jgi:hypothetical protein
MIAHFHHFWSSPDSADKIIRWLNTAVERRANIVRDALISSKPDLVDEFDTTMKEVHASAEQYASQLRQCQKLDVDKLFLFGLHPAPEATIAHLHLHVILISDEFRNLSTKIHDWKTVPAHAVIDVIRDERRRSSNSTKFWWRRLLTSLARNRPNEKDSEVLG